MPQPADVCTSLESVFRREHGRIIASLIRLCGSFDRAEEAMQEAFAAALRYWAEHGVPDNPGAWITTSAYRKLIDARRRDRTRREKQTELEQEIAIGAYEDPVVSEDLTFGIPDDRLRLISLAAIPLSIARRRLP
jgi:RNA polymerase sigma-70 factor (ECF subfamily)